MNIGAKCREVYGSNHEPDGILNPLLYAKAPIKILWLLREAWFKDALNLVRDEGVYARMGNSATLHPMAYVTYSVFQEKHPVWEDMHFLREKPEMAEVLRSVAYINVKKVFGETTSDLNDIYNWFKRGEDIIRAQLSECRPDVVIGCAPYMDEIFRWDGHRSSPIRRGVISYVADPGKPLLIEAPHPSQRSIRRQIYVDALIEVIRNTRRSP